VNRLRNEVSNALLIPVQDAQDYVKVAPVVQYSDETSFKQGNGDGKNPDRKKKAGYGPLFGIGRCFEVALSPGKTVAMRLMVKI
jgi:hypothetical protein